RNQGNMNGDTGYRSRDNTRRTVPVETSDALVDDITNCSSLAFKSTLIFFIQGIGAGITPEELYKWRPLMHWLTTSPTEG
ncbi:hypothetical protein Tco_1468915, partial [Tanacetum coccineum]